jgi:hypothetical protein
MTKWPLTWLGCNWVVVNYLHTYLSDLPSSSAKEEQKPGWMDGWITTILILKYTCQQVLDVSTRILIQKQFTYDIYIYSSTISWWVRQQGCYILLCIPNAMIKDFKLETLICLHSLITKTLNPLTPNTPHIFSHFFNELSKFLQQR